MQATLSFRRAQRKERQLSSALRHPIPGAQLELMGKMLRDAAQLAWLFDAASLMINGKSSLGILLFQIK
ncbi:hypothetical protein TNCV_990341 [Trichonephila clavipes]|nr:hypothetical protein TNCV_990341 [Trichonephila clavipes]